MSGVEHDGDERDSDACLAAFSKVARERSKGYVVLPEHGRSGCSSPSAQSRLPGGVAWGGVDEFSPESRCPSLTVFTDMLS